MTDIFRSPKQYYKLYTVYIICVQCSSYVNTRGCCRYAFRFMLFNFIDIDLIGQLATWTILKLLLLKISDMCICFIHVIVWCIKYRQCVAELPVFFLEALTGSFSSHLLKSTSVWMDGCSTGTCSSMGCSNDVMPAWIMGRCDTSLKYSVGKTLHFLKWQYVFLITLHVHTVS